MKPAKMRPSKSLECISVPVDSSKKVAVGNLYRIMCLFMRKRYQEKMFQMMTAPVKQIEGPKRSKATYDSSPEVERRRRNRSMEAACSNSDFSRRSSDSSGNVNNNPLVTPPRQRRAQHFQLSDTAGRSNHRGERERTSRPERRHVDSQPKSGQNRHSYSEGQHNPPQEKQDGKASTARKNQGNEKYSTTQTVNKSLQSRTMDSFSTDSSDKNNGKSSTLPKPHQSQANDKRSSLNSKHEKSHILPGEQQSRKSQSGGNDDKHRHSLTVQKPQQSQTGAKTSVSSSENDKSYPLPRQQQSKQEQPSGTDNKHRNSSTLSTPQQNKESDKTSTSSSSSNKSHTLPEERRTRQSQSGASDQKQSATQPNPQTNQTSKKASTAGSANDKSHTLPGEQRTRPSQSGVNVHDHKQHNSSPSPKPAQSQASDKPSTPGSYNDKSYSLPGEQRSRQSQTVVNDRKQYNASILPKSQLESDKSSSNSNDDIFRPLSEEQRSRQSKSSGTDDKYSHTVQKPGKTQASDKPSSSTSKDDKSKTLPGDQRSKQIQLSKNDHHSNSVQNQQQNQASDKPSSDINRPKTSSKGQLQESKSNTAPITPPKNSLQVENIRSQTDMRKQQPVKEADNRATEIQDDKSRNVSKEKKQGTKPSTPDSTKKTSSQVETIQTQPAMRKQQPEHATDNRAADTKDDKWCTVSKEKKQPEPNAKPANSNSQDKNADATNRREQPRRSSDSRSAPSSNVDVPYTVSEERHQQQSKETKQTSIPKSSSVDKDLRLHGQRGQQSHSAESPSESNNSKSLTPSSHSRPQQNKVSGVQPDTSFISRHLSLSLRPKDTFSIEKYDDIHDTPPSVRRPQSLIKDDNRSADLAVKDARNSETTGPTSILKGKASSEVIHKSKDNKPNILTGAQNSQDYQTIHRVYSDSYFTAPTFRKSHQIQASDSFSSNDSSCRDSNHVSKRHSQQSTTSESVFTDSYDDSSSYDDDAIDGGNFTERETGSGSSQSKRTALFKDNENPRKDNSAKNRSSEHGSSRMSRRDEFAASEPRCQSPLTEETLKQHRINMRAENKKHNEKRDSNKSRIRDSSSSSTNNDSCSSESAYSSVTATTITTISKTARFAKNPALRRNSPSRSSSHRRYRRDYEKDEKGRRKPRRTRSRDRGSLDRRRHRSMSPEEGMRMRRSKSTSALSDDEEEILKKNLDPAILSVFQEPTKKKDKKQKSKK